MNNYDDEFKNLEQEEDTKRSSFLNDVYNIRKRLNNSKEKSTDNSHLPKDAPKNTNAQNMQGIPKQTSGLEQFGKAGSKTAIKNAGTSTAEIAGKSVAAESKAAATGSATAGGAAAGGTVVGGTGGTIAAETAAGGAVAGGSTIGIIIIAAIVFIILLIGVTLIANKTIEGWSYKKGKDPEYLLSHYKNNSMEEMREELESETDYCNNNFYDNVKLFFESLTPEIDSLCEGLRVINNSIDNAEKKYNIKVSPGIIISTITEAYKFQYEINENNSLDLLTNIFKNNENAEIKAVIKRSDIEKLVDKMIFHEIFTYFTWEIKKDEFGNDIYYCRPNEVNNHYYSFDKYSIFLRYGDNMIDYSGHTNRDLFGKINGEGYEYELNMQKSWDYSSAYCLPGAQITGDGVDYNSISVANNYFKNYDRNKSNVELYLQKDENVSFEKEELKPVYSNGNLYNLNYNVGFIYNSFTRFNSPFNELYAEYDEINDPKNIEININKIEDQAKFYDKIFGYEVPQMEEGYAILDTEWPYFPEGTNYYVHNGSMMACRCNAGQGDFHAAVDISVAAGTRILSPLDGTVISNVSPSGTSCGAGIVYVKSTIPGTDTEVVLQFTHLVPNSVLSIGTKVVANTTTIGRINGASQPGYQPDRCSSGPHLDLKIYKYVGGNYYNPAVFTHGIINNVPYIQYTTYIRNYNGASGASGYDRLCDYKCR